LLATVRRDLLGRLQFRARRSYERAAVAVAYEIIGAVCVLSMLMAMARSRSGRANASDVNCAPWSVLKISGWPKRARASSSASTQKLESSVFGQPPRQHAARVPVR
jgi:hypothetical protein